MDGWGSLTMLIKRQEAAKNRTAKLKHELQKRKTSLIANNKTNLSFKELSSSDLNKIKVEIRKKYKRDRIKIVIIDIILLLISVLIISFIYKIIVNN